MSGRAEKTLVQHLLDSDSLRVLAEEGLSGQIVPTEIVQKMLEWALNYWFESGRQSAPSLQAFSEIEVDKKTFGDWLSDMEIDISVEPDDTIEWAIGALRSTYATKVAQEFAKDLVIKVANAATDDRVSVLDEAAGKLVGLAAELASRSSAVQLSEGIVDRIVAHDERASFSGRLLGASIGLPEVDGYTHGFQAGELVIMAGGPKTGKAQPVDEVVLTPTGWRQMGELQVGDLVCGPHGRSVRVVAVHPQGSIPTYRVAFSDGASAEASGEHLWSVWSHGNGADRIITTLEARDEILRGKRRTLYIPMSDPVVFSDGVEPLSLDPYLLGVLLGDGGMSKADVVLTTADPEVVNEVAAVLPDGVQIRKRSSLYAYGISGIGWRQNRVALELRSMGLMPGRSHTRFIPRQYLTASVRERFSLLQGLMDTDGGVEGKRSISYCTTSPQLAADIRELVEGLGGRCLVSEKPTGHRLAYVLRIRVPSSLGSPFRLPRKSAQWEPPLKGERRPVRHMVSVEYVGEKECQCITVDSEDGLYLTRHAIVTHNSWMTAWAALAEMRAKRRVALFTLENSVPMSIDRIACLAAGVDYSRWQRGECTAAEVEAVVEWARAIQGQAALWVLQPDLGKRSFEHMVREAQIREADTIIIDQLTFVELPSPRKPRHERIGEALHTLKGMISTGRHRMPCILAHQVNREGVKAAEKTGHLEMHHMAESAEVERTADWVFGLYASGDERIAQQLKLQTLASRRAVPRHWQLNWQVGMGHISVRQQIEITN